MTSEDRKAIFSLYPVFFCYAFFLSMLGQFIPYLRQKFSLSLTASGMLSTLQSVGGLITVLIIIVYLDSFNKPKIYGIAGALFALSLAALGLAPWAILVYSMFLISGLAGSVVNTMPNAIISDHAMQRRGFYLNLMHAFFGVGGIAGSQLTSIAAGAAGAQAAFLGYAGLLLICVAFYLAFNRKSFKKPLILAKKSFSEHIGVLKSVIKTDGILYAGGLGFFAGFNMVNILYWTYSYMYSLGAAPASSAFALTAFFIGLTLSRFLVSRFALNIPQGAIVFYGSLIGCVVNAAACFILNIPVLITLFGLLGFFTGSSFPQALIISCSLTPKNSSFASGVVILGYFLASLVGPLLLGWVGDIAGLKYSMLVNAAAYIPTGLLALRFMNLNAGKASTSVKE